MSACNIVRFRVKHGAEEAFVEAHRKASTDWPGFQRAMLVRTGDRVFCFVGLWADMEKMAAARPQMIAVLDSFRDTLEDLGGGLGVTDPASGAVVFDTAAQ
ncbi:antibiotic biosynthesis monooxygenase [Roseomonas sp. HF4]|uniref:antibiotic biosynthesis monooxygenase n=1 Tax=Roseomonas sp. HF4 TaxID=2562313 RepID=UPI0010C094A9|nr:antibiotic biosynthesis monooxygenase [Roseomonas sp. HF4]